MVMVPDVPWKPFRMGLNGPCLFSILFISIVAFISFVYYL